MMPVISMCWLAQAVGGMFAQKAYPCNISMKTGCMLRSRVLCYLQLLAACYWVAIRSFEMKRTIP